MLTIAYIVDHEGKFTKEAGPHFEGKFAFKEGNESVIDDWRTKQPVMLRATAQWFANVESLQEKAVKELENVKMIPKSCKFILC